MINFRTSARHLLTQGALLASLIILTMTAGNQGSVTRVPVIIIVDGAVLIFFLSSLIRRITINGDILECKTLLRTVSIKISEIQYAQALSAFGRFVLILNDGNKTAVFSSLFDGMDKIVDTLRPHLKEEDLKRIEILTPDKIKIKKRVYDSVIIFLIGIVWFGIIRNSAGI